jgi:hypothetical protein
MFLALRSIVAVVAVVVMAGGVAAQPPRSATEVWAEFIQRQNEMTPVTGIFEIIAKSNRTSDEAKPQERNGAVVVPFPSDWVMRCRWSLDSSRELLDCDTSTTKPFDRRFLIEGEASLSGLASATYNLKNTTRVAATRPGSFFFLSAARDRWADLTRPGECELSITTAGEDLKLIAKPTGTRVVYELTTDPKTLLLRRATGTVDGVAIWELNIQAYAASADGQKRFPRAATITNRRPKVGTVRSVETLTATKVAFPVANDEIAAAFNLELSKNTIIADRELKRAAVTDRPMAAADAIRNPSKLKTVPFTTTTPSAVVAPVAASADSNWLRYVWYGITGIIAAVGFTLVAQLVRGLRSTA